LDETTVLLPFHPPVLEDMSNLVYTSHEAVGFKCKCCYRVFASQKLYLRHQQTARESKCVFHNEKATDAERVTSGLVKVGADIRYII
jgi:hypothetical protein